jgi:hypothetical protein
MPLPSSTDLATLDIAHLGAPFVHVEAKPLDSETLDVAYLGAPFVAVGPAAATGLNVWTRVSGVWKQAVAMYVRVGGVWKSVTTVSTRVSGTWKS